MIIVFMTRCYHNHQITMTAPSFQTLSCHPSLSSITLLDCIKSLHRADICKVHNKTLLMCSSLLLQQCPTCLVCLTWRWKLSGCRVLLPEFVQNTAFLCNSSQAFSPCVLLDFMLCIHHHHHHDVVPPARISLTLSRHFSLSFIASGRSSGLHPVSSHSCSM